MDGFDLSLGLNNGLEAKRIKPPKRVERALDDEGIMGIAYVGFDVELGPKIEYYYANGGSTFIKKLLKNPALVAELTIIGKYANEVVTESNEKLLIKKIVSKDDLNRETPHFIVIELKGKKKRFAKDLIDKLSSNKTVNNVSWIKKFLSDSLVS